MPVKTLEKKEFIYIVYRRGGIIDFLDFRNAVDSSTKIPARRKNLIIDLSKNGPITESEINVLVLAMRKFMGTSLTLFVIAGQKTREKLQSTRLADAPGVRIFDDHPELFAALKKKHPPESSSRAIAH
jgi:hypothetical protein